jgi:hypothetical protein
MHNRAQSALNLPPPLPRQLLLLWRPLAAGAFGAAIPAAAVAAAAIAP